MIQKHEEEKKEVEVAHVEEITEFNNYWDQKMTEYQQEAEKVEEDLMQKH
jgi:hypothetical protein